MFSGMFSQQAKKENNFPGINKSLKKENSKRFPTI